MSAAFDIAGVPSNRPLVLAVVGTDHHPFDRIIGWMDAWARAHPDHYCLVQYGTSRQPQVCAGVDYLGHPDLVSLMERASAVISHGGPGTIMEIRSAGLEPVVVARDPAHGEHVDGHQLRFVNLMSAKQLVRAASSESTLECELAAVLAGVPRPDRRVGPPGSGEAAALAFGALVEPLMRRHRSSRNVQE